jgi:hypothetical protein
MPQGTFGLRPWNDGRTGPSATASDSVSTKDLQRRLLDVGERLQDLGDSLQLSCSRDFDQ